MASAISLWKGTARFCALLIFVMTFNSACALKFDRLGDKEEEPDPITLLRRDLRQLRADHRVALFDLKKEREAEIERLRAEFNKEAAEKEKERFALRKRDADFSEQIAELEMQIRILGGSLEEEVNRLKELSDRKNTDTAVELAHMRSALDKREKQAALSDQSLKSRLEGHLKEEEEARKSVQAQLDSMRAFNEGLQQSSNEQIKALKAVSDQVTELIDKVLPAVNALGQRVDQNEAASKTLKREVDTSGLNQKLNDLTKALEAQRKSLDMLGNTLTAQVDQQRKLLQQTQDRLQVLEAKGASAKK